MKKNNQGFTQQQAAEGSEGFFREVEIEFLIHELKDPIAVIETGLRTLLEKRDTFGSLTARQEKTVRRALRNTHKARQMLNGLLEVGRSETGCFHCGRFQPARSVYAALLDALETTGKTAAADGHFDSHGPGMNKFLEAHGVYVDISPEADELEIFQDEIKFRQIIGNLIKNAIHYRRRRVDIRIYRLTDQLCVDVCDDGPGVDPKERELIFERYTQGDQCRLPLRNGHGLGLAGARIIARCLGGEIELETKGKKGATFRMRLPVSLQSGSPQTAES